MKPIAWELEHSVEADVALSFAWNWRTDVTTWDDPPARFQLNGPFVTGSRGTTVLPGQEPLGWQIRDVRPGRLFIIEMALDRAILAFEWRFEAVSSRRTRITQRIILSGDNAAAYESDVRTSFESTLADGMKRIADAMGRAHRSDSSSRVHTRLVHAGAVLLILAALAHGLAMTHSRDWPDGPDTFRDIGAAEMMRETIGPSLHRRTPLPDLYYRDEVFWYSPLMPALLAASAAIARAPMHVVATRIPVFWNLGGPIAFYACAAVLFDPIVAFVALALFLFVQPFPAREAGTYAPALITSSFAQAFFYLALVAWAFLRRNARVWSAVAAGCVLGVSFLAHTAVTAILAVVFIIDALAWLYESPPRERLRTAALCALVAGIGVIASVPAMIPLIHYHFQIRELEPFVFLYPQMGPAHALEVLRVNLDTNRAFTGAAAIGLIALLVQPSSMGRRLTLAWSAVALVLFVWAAWVVRLAMWEWVARLAIAPAHHFLIYIRAAESLFGGIGIAALIRLVQSRTRFAVELPLAACVIAALIAVNFSRYRDRDTHMRQPEFSENQKAAVEWIMTRADPSSVFLAPENTGVSMIGIVRRKTVLVEPVFSNPYVEWEPRFEAWQGMWASLEAKNCGEFTTRAAQFDVTHVLLVDGLTPPVEDGACGFRKVFEAAPFTILSRVPDRPVSATTAYPFF
jgi:hypothetical protein